MGVIGSLSRFIQCYCGVLLCIVKQSLMALLTLCVSVSELDSHTIWYIAIYILTTIYLYKHITCRAEYFIYKQKRSQRCCGRTTLVYRTRASTHIEIYSTSIYHNNNSKTTQQTHVLCLRRLSEWKAIRCDPRRYPHATRFRIIQQAFGSVVFCVCANHHIHGLFPEIFYHANNIVKCTTAYENQ